MRLPLETSEGGEAVAPAALVVSSALGQYHLSPAPRTVLSAMSALAAPPEYIRFFIFFMGSVLGVSLGVVVTT